MAGSMFSDFIDPEPDERDLPLAALARQLGVWIPPDLNSNELPFAGLARPFGVMPLPGHISDQDGPDPADVMLVADKQTTASNPVLSDILRYPDGSPVIDPNADENGEFHPYPRPPKMDVSKNLEFGQGLAGGKGVYVETGFPIALDARELGMIQAFSSGAAMDHKRPDGYLAVLFGDRNYEYRRVTYYNYGAVSAAAGYSRDEALQAARDYNRMFGSGSADLSDDARQSIATGWGDSNSGRWSNSGTNSKADGR